MWEIRVRTTKRVEAVNITREVEGAVKGKDGRLMHLFTPHTTCGLLVNEDADPNVIRDIMEALERISPIDYPYKHTEGNAHAHIRSSLIGASLMIPFSAGRPLLGTWQGIFLMEFDGPRERRVVITLLD
jgi:secondary thiamine-phosphate synthase enzyme